MVKKLHRQPACRIIISGVLKNQEFDYGFAGFPAGSYFANSLFSAYFISFTDAYRT